MPNPKPASPPPRAPRYLYIDTESQRPAIWSSTEPTPGDLELALTSLSILIRLSDWHCYGPAGRWLPIVEAQLLPDHVDDGIGVPSRHVDPRDLRRPARRSARK